MATPLNPTDLQPAPDDLDLIDESVVEPSSDAAFDVAVDEEAALADPQQDIDPGDDIPIQEEPQEEIQVAGGLLNLVGAGIEAVAGGVKRKLENTQPIGRQALEADEPVRRVGEFHVIREPTEAEAAQINTLLDGVGGKPPQYEMNLDRILQSEDAEGIEKSIMEMARDYIDAEKRGNRTFEKMIAGANLKLGGGAIEAVKERIAGVIETVATAERGGGEFKLDGILETILTREVGQPINAETLIAGRIALQIMNNETTRLQRLVADGDVSPETKQKFLNAIGIEGAFMAKLIGGRAEAARTTAANRIIPELDETRSMDLSRLIEEGGGMQSVEWLAHAYAALPTAESRSRMSRGIFGKAVDVWQEVFLNSLLSAFTTDTVNITSNTAFMMLQIPERFGAFIVGKGRLLVAPNSGPGVDAAETWDMVKGLGKGTFDAFVMFGRTMRTGEPQSSFRTKLEVQGRQAITSENFGLDGAGVWGRGVDILGNIVRLPGRFLISEDEFFKAWNARAQLEALASRKMRRAIQSGVPEDTAMADKAADLRDPPESMLAAVRSYQETSTFTNDLEGMMANLGQTMNNPFVRMFVPFFKTPTNIVIQVMKRTPLGLMSPEFMKLVKSGDKADVDLAVSRIALGTIMMASVAYATHDQSGDTIVTGSGPSARGSQDAWRRQGLQPYSVCSRGEGDRYTCSTYSRLEPVSALVAMAVDYNDYARYSANPEELEQLAMALILAGTEYSGQLPMVQGMSEIAALMGQNYEGDESRVVGAINLIAKKFTDATIGAVMAPSILASIERMNDPTASNTKENPNTPMVVKGFYEALNKMKSRNPFFSDDVPPNLNLWAEPIVVGRGSVQDLFNPIRRSNGQQDALDNEIENLNFVMGGKLRKPAPKIDGVGLDAAQHNELIERMNLVEINGDTMRSSMMDVMMSDQYQDSGVEERASLLNEEMSEYLRLAKDEMIASDGHLAAKVEFLKKSFEDQKAIRQAGEAP